jgi:hypothetical protein
MSYSDNADLTREAVDVFVWCLTQNTESYKQWVSSLFLFGLVLLSHARNLWLNNLDFQERIYPENIEASVAVLSKIVIDWKDVSPKLNVEALKATVKNLKAKVSQMMIS